MIFFLKQFKASQLKSTSYKLNAGMTYVELIVVLSIFSTLSGTVLFSYKEFQDRIDVKNMSSDIALKITEAQKSSIAGRLPPRSYTDTWKPSYGVHFKNPTMDNINFVYFVNLDESTNNDGYYDGLGCTVSSGECLEQISLTKGNTISSLKVHYSGYPDDVFDDLDDLTISFKRPGSSANIVSTSIPTSGTPPVPVNAIDYVEITILSPQGNDAKIKVYPFGKIEIK